MDQTKNRFKLKILFTTLLLSAVFLLALCKIGTADAWIHLYMGKYIWHAKELPSVEPFIYTMTGEPVLYSSWLFGLIYYLAYLLFNIYGVILLKAFTVATVFYILLKDSVRTDGNYALAAVMLVVVAILTRYRFTERPETFMMLFLSFSIFSLNAFVYEGRKYIYALPVISLLWANMHSSIGLMFIPFLSFVFGGTIQRFLGSRMTFSNTPSKSQLSSIALISVLSFAASLINPNFIGQYMFGTQFLASGWYKKNIVELQPPSWEIIKWPYLFTAAILASFAIQWITAYRKSGLKEHPPITDILLVIPFIVLSFTAMRFMALLGIVGGPVLIRSMAAYAPESLKRPFFGKTGAAVSVILLIAITILAISRVEPFGDKKKIFGFGIDYYFAPEGALAYMDKRGISGRVYNTINYGGYIVWRDFPKRSAFIDPRVYSTLDLLEGQYTALRNPALFDSFEEKYGFDSALIEYPNIAEDMPRTWSDLAFSNQKWALVYWDDKYLLYLKIGGKYDHVIKEDQYRFIKPANGISRSLLRDIGYRSDLIKELKRNIEATNSSKAHAFSGFIYNEMGLYEKAIESYSKVRDVPLQSHIGGAYKGMAYAYSKIGDLDKSIEYYTKSLAVQEDPDVFSGLGLVYEKKGDRKKASEYFKKALKVKQPRKEESGEVHFKRGVDAYFKRQYEIAIEEFNRSIEANPSNPLTYSNLGFVYFDLGMIDKALECQQKAIEIAPDLANAYYGLAQIYKKKGNVDMVIKQFQEYLRIEPDGFYSDLARKEINAIK